jgi:hypothetical protein
VCVCFVVWIRNRENGVSFCDVSPHVDDVKLGLRLPVRETSNIYPKNVERHAPINS